MLECVLIFVWPATCKCMTNSLGFINTGQNEMGVRRNMESENEWVRGKIWNIQKIVGRQRRKRIEKSTFPLPEHVVNHQGAFLQPVMLPVSLPPPPGLGWSTEWECCMCDLMNWFLQEEREIDSEDWEPWIWIAVICQWGRGTTC